MPCKYIPQVIIHLTTHTLQIHHFPQDWYMTNCTFTETVMIFLFSGLTQKVVCVSRMGTTN